ncbi:hypothetical protein TrVE_jg13778 [Triparma verrucosa]|uniref:Calmodulin n=1 Tax=Triparma verrucosa TaxID=1606542 RepID=A0A9W7C8K5_9STRA|nr:hypothetical protein TrVE_jg13778 [Triparma verrucosa]
MVKITSPPSITLPQLSSEQIRKPVTTVDEFPNSLEASRKLPPWGKTLSTEFRRSRTNQPSLMSKTGYTATHYIPKEVDNTVSHSQILSLLTDPIPRETRMLKKWKEAYYLYEAICQPQYRSGSFENALWGLSVKEIGKQVFVQAIISEFKFDRKLRMEEHLERLYENFDNAENDRVDYRLIQCTYLNLTLYRLILDKPRHLFFLMYDIFCEPFSDTVLRSDCLNLISLAAATDEEFAASRFRLNDALTEMAPTRGLKPNFRLVEKSMLKEVFEVHPGIMLSFKDQCWARLHEDQRLHILGKKEDQSAKGFEYQDFKFKARQALQLWTRALLASSFRSWDEYKEESLRIKSQRLWMLYRSAKRRLRQWRVMTELALAKRERVKIAWAMGKLIIKRARFLRWARLVITTRRMLRACHKYDNKFKTYGDGLGHLRYGWWRWKSRLLLQRWDDETKFIQRVEYATKWCKAKFKLRVWNAFKKEIKQRIIEKNKELDMVDRQKWLTDMMGDADEELKKLTKEKEAAMLAKQIALEEEEARERIRNRNLQNARKKAERGAGDRMVRDIQREERRKRVEAEKQKIFDEWADEWDGENKQRRTFNPNRTKYRKKHGDTSGLECWRCGREGHFYKTCYYLDHIHGIHVYENAKETLEDIASKYKITVRQLEKWNHIESHKDLVVGQNVRIVDIDDGNWHASQQKPPGENWTWDFVDVCRSRVGNWLNSKDKDAKEKTTKAFKNLRREFYMPPTIENTYREAQLNSECNIALATIDGIMFSKGILGRELFEKFDESGDGYVTYEEFQSGIDAFGLNIEHSWIRSIVKTIDKEGDGYIGVEELQEAMERTYEFNGVQGSPWKMYVSIAHQILVFHNVVTDQMVFEHDMTNAILKEIVKANFIAEKEVAERNHILDLKAKDLIDRKEYYAATKLQFFYWKWTALRDMAKQRWKLEQHELSIMRKKERKFALMWQTAWRKFLARKQSWFRVQLHYQKMVDMEAGGALCYFNHLTGDKTYERPKIFFLLLNRQMGEDLDEPLPWSIQYDDEGYQYWYNMLTREKIVGKRYDDGFGEIIEKPAKKPAGYPICLSCNIELAWKICKQCDFAYCFHCFRNNHNYVGADRHTWTIQEPIHCSLCKKNVAAKRAKGKEFCQKCFDRLEKSGVFRGKAVGKIEDV